MKKKILFVNALFEDNTPRSIRTQNFIKHLKNDNEIHVIYFKFKEETIKIPEVHIHAIQIGNLFRRWFLKTKPRNLIARALYKIISSSKKMVDIFYFDMKNLSKQINEIEKRENFDKIIISISPFSLYQLAKYISFEKVILDIGDPLFKNSAYDNSRDEIFYDLEQKALLKTNRIIVTNVETKNHFIDCYKMNSEYIQIGPQGFDEEAIFKIKNDIKIFNNEKNIIRLVYAGRFYKELRDPTEFIKGIQSFNLKNNNLKIQFDIYGGQGMNIIEGNGVSILPSLDQTKVFSQIYYADYNVFFDNKRGMQTPGKIYENLALSTPLLFIKASNTSKSFELVKNCKGIIFMENNFDEIEACLRILKPNDTRLECSFDLSVYSWENLAKKIIN